MGASPLQRCSGCLAVSASFLPLRPVAVAPQLAKRTTTQASLGSNKAMRQLEVPQDLRKAIPGCSCTLAIAFALDCVETPSIASISPVSMMHGTPDLVVIVNGEEFQRNSTIHWNGVPLSRPH